MLVHTHFFAKAFVILAILFSFSEINAQNAANPEFQDSNSQSNSNNQTLQITLHKAKLANNGKAQYLKETGNVVVDDALSASEIKSGFKANEKVVIRVKSPYPFYIYIVNYSDLDGTRLVQPFGDKATNEQFPANKYKDFLFNFTKSKTDSKTREEFLILVSKTKFESTELNEFLRVKAVSFRRLQK